MISNNNDNNNNSTRDKEIILPERIGTYEDGGKKEKEEPLLKGNLTKT